MIISSKSWHYRFINFAQDNYWAHPKDLCSYIRLLLLSIFSAHTQLWAYLWDSILKEKGSEGITKITARFLEIGFLFGILGLIIQGYIGTILEGLSLGLIILGMFLIPIGIAFTFTIALIAFPFFWFNDKLEKQKNNIKVEDNLFLSWLKAKKEKVCPLVTYINN